MQYLLVENKQIVHLGPIFWKHRFIQSELEDLDIVYQVPPVEPNSYLKITDSVEIFPVEPIIQPAYDPTYEQLVGPFWTFTDVATGTYTITARDLSTIKSVLKEQAAAERYKKEVSGVKVVVQDQEVLVDTSREGRSVFVQKYSMMADTDTVQWKFPSTWLTLTKTELGTGISGGAAHIEAQFVWEQNIVSQIDAALSAEGLKAINIIEPTSTPGVP